MPRNEKQYSHASHRNSEKKDYKTPQLIIHGTAKELTKAGGAMGSEMAASGSMAP